MAIPDTVSVIIPVHNQAAFLTEAVESALAQGQRVIEIIVVDDGSLDHPEKILHCFHDPRIKLITQAQKGPSSARNQGWKASSGNWIQFLDGDDSLEPEALEHHFRAMQSGNRDIPYGLQAIYGPELCGKPTFTTKLAAKSGDLLQDIACWYFASIFTALLPKDALLEIGGFDEKILRGEDFDLAIRLACHRQFQFINKVVYRTRMHGANRHRGFGLNGRQIYLQILEKNFSQPPLLAKNAIFKRAMAHQHWTLGQFAMEERNSTAARHHFLMAIRYHTLKLGAWKGLFRSVISGR